MNRTSPAAGPADPSHSSFSVFYLSKLVYRWLWLLGLILLVTMSIALLYLHHATPYYRATTVLQVEQEQQRVFKSDSTGDTADDLKSDDSLKTIEQNLQGFGLFMKVASDSDIAGDPNIYTGISRGGRPLTTLDLAAIIQENTRVSLRRGTRLIDISVDHPVPSVAQELSRAIAQEYIDQSGELNLVASTGAERQLTKDSERIKDKLQKSEDALATYQEALLLKDRISDQQRILDALQQRYRAKHPALIQARALMAELVLDFDREVKKIRTNSSLESGFWEQRDENLHGLSPQDRVQTELQLVEARTNVLDGEVETERSLFNNVLKQGSEATMNKQAAPTEVLIVGEPALPQKPVRPAKKVILLIGSAGGLVLGLGLIFFLNALDSSFKMAEEVEQYLGLPVLGALPQVASKKGPLDSPVKDHARDNIVLVSDPGSIAAESFRSMRASLGLLGKSTERKSFLFTSALAGEGKTFVSCNYAVSLAQQGIKTLLMDIDLRCPAVHQFFGLENKKGLVDHVSRGLALDQAIYKDVVPNLDVLTPGSRCPNPAEFLSGTGFADTLKEALTKYDRIIVDCSPINLVSDSLLVVANVQSVVLVVRAKSTPRRDAKFALTTLQRANVQPVGVVINAIPDWTRQLYYAHPGRYGGGDKYLRAYA
jgi:succinoglycan biosynthesis transport protein ExoP